MLAGRSECPKAQYSGGLQAIMQNCPICKAPLSPGASDCARCGYIMERQLPPSPPPLSSPRPRFRISLTLWIVLAAIVVLLVTVAIPRPGDYVESLKVKDLVVAASACQQPFAEFVARHGRLPTNAREVGCPESKSLHASQIEIAGTQIKATLRSRLYGMDRKIIFQALDGTGSPAEGGKPVASWHCGTDAERSYWARFPAACAHPLLPVP